MLTINDINRMDEGPLYKLLEQGCAAEAWITGMIKARPYTDSAALLRTSEEIWQGLANDDYLEAFRAHPMIGDVNSLAKKYTNTAATAASEQSGTHSASQATLQGLVENNRAYLDKHGFIFIIFATGKSASEMLDALMARLNNSTEQEIANAAGEQLKITHLRIHKLFEGDA